jgi:hypothetical protein
MDHNAMIGVASDSVWFLRHAICPILFAKMSLRFYRVATSLGPFTHARRFFVLTKTSNAMTHKKR